MAARCNSPRGRPTGSCRTWCGPAGRFVSRRRRSHRHYRAERGWRLDRGRRATIRAWEGARHQGRRDRGGVERQCGDRLDGKDRSVGQDRRRCHRDRHHIGSCEGWAGVTAAMRRRTLPCSRARRSRPMPRQMDLADMSPYSRKTPHGWPARSAQKAVRMAAMANSPEVSGEHLSLTGDVDLSAPGGITGRCC